MRYFLLGLVLLCVVVVSVAGLRGTASRRPPIEIFSDMDRQPRLRPQKDNGFFEDGLSSQGPIPGTISRGERYEQNVVTTGRVSGTTNFVAAIPVEVTEELMRRGRDRYNIHCAICHGGQGDGQGIVTKYGVAGVANFHSEPLVNMPAGQLYSAIAFGAKVNPETGIARMPSYGAALGVDDRWAVVAYVRALQRSRLATIEDVPEGQRANLE